ESYANQSFSTALLSKRVDDYIMSIELKYLLDSKAISCLRGSPADLRRVVIHIPHPVYAQHSTDLHGEWVHHLIEDILRHIRFRMSPLPLSPQAINICVMEPKQWVIRGIVVAGLMSSYPGAKPLGYLLHQNRETFEGPL